MKFQAKLLLNFLPVAVFVIFLGSSVSSCAAEKKNPWYEKRMKASKSNTNQLGRNRYYFSSEYQKKLYKSYKRK